MCDNCQAARETANKIADELSSADKSREFYRRQGECREQERIIKLLASFWCGEPACTKHPVRMDWVIAGIKGEQK